MLQGRLVRSVAPFVRVTAMAVITVIFIQVLVLSLGSAPPQVLAAGVVDQQQTHLGGAYNASPGFGVAQTFTAGLTGQLDQVDVFVFGGGSTGDLTAEIRDVIGGVPGATVLTTATLPEASIPASAFATLTFSPSISVVSGTQYAIVLNTPNSSNGNLIAYFHNDPNRDPNPYAAGSLFLYTVGTGSFAALPNYDLVFKTYVVATSTSTPTATTMGTPLPPETPTSTATAMTTTTVTPTATATSVPVATVTVTQTTTSSVDVASQVASPEDDTDKPRRRTDEQRQQGARTNASNLDQYHTDGNVIAVERPEGATYLLVTVALTRQETQVVQVFCSGSGTGLSCPDIHVGDYLEADGYQNGVGDPNTWFVASDGVEVTRNGRRIK